MEVNKADQETFADRKNINDLPDEILDKIFDNLRLKIMVKARFVCQRWNEVLHYTIGKNFLNRSADILKCPIICNDCGHICNDCGSKCSKHLKYMRPGETEFNRMLELIFGLYGDRVKTIGISHGETIGISHPGFCTLEAQNSLTRIAKYCPNIENIEIKFIFIPASIKELMKLLAFSCPKIKRVCFSQLQRRWGSIVTSDLKFSINDFTYLFEELPLEVFSLKTVEATTDLPFISFPKSLQEFSLTTFKSNNSTALVKSLAKSCPNLQRLSIKSEFSHELLDILAHRCPNITKLQFSFSEEQLNLRKFQNLKSVGLYVNKKIFCIESLPQSIEEVFIECAEYLYHYQYHQKNYHDLDYYLNTIMKFSQLKSLKMSFFIPEDKLRELAKKCPNLEYLQFCWGTVDPKEVYHFEKLFKKMKYFKPFLTCSYINADNSSNYDAGYFYRYVLDDDENWLAIGQ